MPPVSRSKSMSRPVIDFSNMPPKYVSEPIVFLPTTEQKLAEALAEVELLKKNKASLEKEFRDYMNERTAAIAELLTENTMVKEENVELHKRVDTLTDRIRDPFKSAMRARF